MVSKLDLKLKEFKDLLKTNNNFKQCLKNIRMLWNLKIIVSNTTT